jgi:hypothetical protein
VHILNRLRNTLFNYTKCFDPNKSSSGVFSYISFVKMSRDSAVGIATGYGLDD